MSIHFIASEGSKGDVRYSVHDIKRGTHVESVLSDKSGKSPSRTVVWHEPLADTSDNLIRDVVREAESPPELPPGYRQELDMDIEEFHTVILELMAQGRVIGQKRAAHYVRDPHMRASLRAYPPASPALFAGMKRARDEGNMGMGVEVAAFHEEIPRLIVEGIRETVLSKLGEITEEN